MGAELEELQVQDLGCEGSGGAHVSTAVLEKVLRALFGAERACALLISPALPSCTVKKTRMTTGMKKRKVMKSAAFRIAEA